MSDLPKIIMVCIEPTPYVLDLIRALEKKWRGKIDVLFINENFTQQWHIDNQHKILDKKTRRFTYLFKHYFNNKKYDAIFLAGWNHPTILFFLIMAKLYRIPVIVDSDTSLFRYTPFWKQVIKKCIYPILFKLPNHFLPSGTRQAQYLKHYLVPDHKITLEKMTVNVLGIQNYIQQFSDDARKKLRDQWRMTNNDFVFLFVGRLITRKGIEDLINAFSSIKNINIKCIIAGDGPLKTRVEIAAKNDQRLIYAGWLENKALLDLYLISDVFVLPAHWEPWGLVINEALAAGKPVIVSDQVGCVDDLVISGKTGIVFPAKNVTALKEAMIGILDDAKKREIYSKNAYQLIGQWTLQDSADQIMGVWERLIYDV